MALLTLFFHPFYRNNDISLTVSTYFLFNIYPKFFWKIVTCFLNRFYFEKFSTLHGFKKNNHLLILKIKSYWFESSWKNEVQEVTAPLATSNSPLIVHKSINFSILFWHWKKPRPKNKSLDIIVSTKNRNHLLHHEPYTNPNGW